MRAWMVVFVSIWLAGMAAAQPVYPSSPDWISADTPVSTGGALVDLDQDGWLDFVVANGNDIAEEQLVVYYNQGDGTFPSTPDWQSSDALYNGHLDVADVNGDGWPDVAVATLGAYTDVGPAARLYLNNAGTLSSLPDWEAHVDQNAFTLAFGDMNNDGRPDLAVATGWPYSSPDTFYNYVYMNVDGELEATPSWTSSDQFDYGAVLWTDAIGNGWLDVLMAGTDHETWMYLNAGGTLGTSGGWHTIDNPGQYSVMMTVGDVSGDGLRDLFVTDNTQLFAGSGEIRQYNGQLGGFATTPNWSHYDGYGSAAALADINSDGLLDLATGAWWNSTRIFLNNGNGFDASPDWSSSVTSVIEKIVFGDIDKDGVRPVTKVFPVGPGTGRLFYLDHQPVEAVTAVVVNGAPLGPDQYHVNREHGWLTVGVDVTTSMVVEYTVSSRLDMAITNWDGGKGNYVYYNLNLVMGDANCDGQLSFGDINPFVLLLTGAYDQVFPDCDGATFCDFNGDDVVDFLDINPFVAALAG
jgi:hypothetical protein